MAGDLLPALDPLLDPRSPAAQAVLNRTPVLDRKPQTEPAPGVAGRVLRPRCRSGPRLPATAVPVEDGACAAGVLGSSRGEVLRAPYRHVVTRRVARRPQTPPAWHRRLALAG